MRVLLAIVGSLAYIACRPAVAGEGRLLLEVVDGKDQRPLVARLELDRVVRSRRVPVRLSSAIAGPAGIVLDGSLRLELPRGQYEFRLTRGKEYRPIRGHFQMVDHGDDRRTIEMRRAVDMAAEGWISGDLQCHPSLRNVSQWMRATDLHFVPQLYGGPTPGKTSKQPLAGGGPREIVAGRWLDECGGRQLTSSGLLHCFREPTPQIATDELQLVTTIQQFRQRGGHLDLPHPFQADLPLWLALGAVDSIGMAHDHLLPNQVVDDEGRGRPRDRERFPSPQGNPLWGETIYYHVLNSGLRIAPSAGSGAGLRATPLGYNRVYVQCGRSWNPNQWWDGLRAGRVCVTNGPLLQTDVEGHPPGHVFQVAEGAVRSFQIGLSLHTAEKIDYLEIVQDGRAVHHVRLDQWVEARGRLPQVTFRRSGWFLVRAMTNTSETYRFAMTGPYYVEFPAGPRVDREAVQFFLDWIGWRTEQLRGDSHPTAARRLASYGAAAPFWQDRLESSRAPR